MSSRIRCTSSYGAGINGYHESNGESNGDVTSGQRHKSLLEPSDTDKIQDLICIGFGPASLAIAIALHDGLETQDPSLPSIHGRPPKVTFLEKQSQFSWHSGMLLEGTRMQITFVKDMATLRNPRSSFTFLNYLYQMQRLVQFTNLSTFLPQRVEFEDYLKWCASWFDDVVQYGQEVIDVSPLPAPKDNSQIKAFEVTSRNAQTGTVSAYRARNIVIAVGGLGTVPPPFPQSHPLIIHSSQYAHTTPLALPSRDAPHRIAIIGSGQSAAEIFNDLHLRYPNSRTSLIIREGALKPSDDSPFVNEIFDPDRVDGFYAQSCERRRCANAENRGTNYGVVRLELLERVYEGLYMQRVRYGNDETRWPHRILTGCCVRGVEVGDGEVRLSVNRNGEKTDDVMGFDFVVVATGYTRTAHERLLQHARYLLPGGDVPGKIWSAERDYRVRFEDGLVSEDAGVWLQGCNEDTHGLSDTLLSILAVRGGDIVQSIFG